MSKIGILDSGVGGLSVLKEVYFNNLADEVYFLGDTKYFPYGIKPVEFIQERVFEIVSFFKNFGVEEVIVACNTASSVAYDFLVDNFRDIKIHSIVLGAIEGIKSYAFKKVGVLATKRTKESNIYPNLIHERISKNVEVYVQSCSDGPLLETIEKGIVEGEIIEKEIIKCTDPLVENGIEGLILGCTHLPFIKGVIKNLYPNLFIVDPSLEVVRFLSKANSIDEKNVEIFVTGEAEEFQAILNKLLGTNWTVKKVSLDRRDISVIKG